jgi:alkylation response protein AidB-like acyl-CoA dehydrogenase
MSFAFNDEQEQLRETVRRFLERHSPETEVRRLMDTEDGNDPAVWNQMASQLGLQGLAIAEEFGGSGGTFVELGIVLEQMGRTLLCAPFFSTVVMAAQLIADLDDDQAKTDFLPGIASGATRATVAITEEDGLWTVESIALRATRVSGEWTLSGVKNYVLDGAHANLILVVARTGDGIGVFAVDENEPGLTRQPLPTMDLTRKQARLTFSQVRARRVGPDSDAWPTVERSLQLAAVGLAAEQLGGAQRSLEMAVEYAKIREQFGRPIGSFQAIKHKCASMLVEIESMKSAAYYGLWAASSNDAELATVASVAKVYCSDAYTFVTGENIQIHGGVGFTWEHPAHLYYKRARSSRVLLGSPDHHREILSGLFDVKPSELITERPPAYR